MTVQSVAATQVALTQARVQTEVATRLLRWAQQNGGPQQVLQLVEQTAAAAAHSAQSAAVTAADGVDTYA